MFAKDMDTQKEQVEREAKALLDNFLNSCSQTEAHPMSAMMAAMALINGIIQIGVKPERRAQVVSQLRENIGAGVTHTQGDGFGQYL